MSTPEQSNDATPEENTQSDEQYLANLALEVNFQTEQYLRFLNNSQ